MLSAEEEITGQSGEVGERIDEVSDVPRTGHLGAGRYWTVGLDSKEWVGCGMLFVGSQHRGSSQSHDSA